MNYYERLLNNKKEFLNSLGSGYYADLLREKYNDFPDHDGRPGQVGGSLPRGESAAKAETTEKEEQIKKEREEAERKAKATNTYNQIIETHTKKGFIAEEPAYFEGETMEEALSALGFDENGEKTIATPIAEFKTRVTDLQHVVEHETDKKRKRFIFHAVKTLEGPNVIIRDGKIFYYIKLFYHKQGIRPHLSIVKVLEDASFIKTNYSLKRSKFIDIIQKGQIVYDLSQDSNTSLSKEQGIIHNSFVPRCTYYIIV